MKTYDCPQYNRQCYSPYMEANPNTINVMKHKMIKLLNERVTTDKGHGEELNTLAFDIVSTFIHAGWRRVEVEK